MGKPKHMKFLHRIICGNTFWQYILNKLLLVNHLTTYTISDILWVCIKRRKSLQSSIVPDACTNGILVTLKKNQRFALNAIALIGKNPVRKSKREWSRAIGTSQWLWITINSVDFWENRG